MTEENKKDKIEPQTSDEVWDTSGISVTDHLKIRDPDTGEVLLSVHGSMKKTGREE
jgi:hypothetical protein